MVDARVATSCIFSTWLIVFNWIITQRFILSTHIHHEGFVMVKEGYKGKIEKKRKEKKRKQKQKQKQNTKSLQLRFHRSGMQNALYPMR